jgi:hypothetical protein
MGGDVMSEGAISIKKAISVIVVTWILSLITTLAVVYVAPNIFPIGTTHISDGAVATAKIADSAIVTTKLADGNVTSAKIMDGTLTAADIADGAVTSLKLTSQAIPFSYTYNPDVAATTSTTWVDMPDMSVTITLARTSHLIIIFSATAYLGALGDSLNVRAITDVAIPHPVVVVLTRDTQTTMGSHSFTWNLPDVSAGIHTVKIQWAVEGGLTTGYVSDRSLTVIALPA